MLHQIYLELHHLPRQCSTSCALFDVACLLDGYQANVDGRPERRACCTIIGGIEHSVHGTPRSRRPQQPNFGIFKGHLSLCRPSTGVTDALEHGQLFSAVGPLSIWVTRVLSVRVKVVTSCCTDLFLYCCEGLFGRLDRESTKVFSFSE